MVKGIKGILIFELFLIGFIGISISVLFVDGTDWRNIQMAALLIFMAILIPAKIEAGQKKICIINGKSVILFSVLAWILLDPLTMRENLNSFSPEVMTRVFLMIILFFIAVYVGYLIKWPPYFARFARQLDYGCSFDGKKLLMMAFISFCLGFLPLIIWGRSIEDTVFIFTTGGRFFAPWGRGAYGGWSDYAKTALGYFNILAIQLTIFYLFFVRKNLILILISIPAIWMVFNTGTRSALAAVLLPGFLLFYLDKFNKKQKARYVIIAFMYLFLSVMQFQLLMRDADKGTPLAELLSNSFFGILQTSPTEYHRDDQFFQMAKAAKYVPGRIPYSGEFLVARILYHFIPRAIWPGKPVGITSFFEESFDTEGTTLAISTIGEFYICQGWLGICIIGIFMGFLSKQFDSLIDMAKRSPAILMMYSYGLIFLFISIRSYQVIYEGWFVFVLFYFVFRYIKKPVNPNTSRSLGC